MVLSPGMKTLQGEVAVRGFFYWREAHRGTPAARVLCMTNLRMHEV